MTITWEPPAGDVRRGAGRGYNVYPPSAAAAPGAAGVLAAAPVPLNPKPLDVTTYTRAGSVAGEEQCFVVRSVATIGTAADRERSVGPDLRHAGDTFPPAAPTGLAAVSGAGVINLIWDANTRRRSRRLPGLARRGTG